MPEETTYQYIVDLDCLGSQEHLKLEYFERLRQEGLVKLVRPGLYESVEAGGKGGAS